MNKLLEALIKQVEDQYQVEIEVKNEKEKSNR